MSTILALAVVPLLAVPQERGNGPAPSLTFVDVAQATGTLAPSYGRAAAMVDLDGDGRLDLVAANSGGPSAFLRQLSDGTFQDVTAAWQIPLTNNYTWGALVADFDEDGDPDVFFVNGGFSGIQPNQVLRNDLASAGAFTDVSAQAGDALGPNASFGGTCLDYDRDGDIDVFISNHSDSETATCTLLRNDGGLVFTDVSAQAGITQLGNYGHCTAGDVDNDGWPDVAVGYMRVGPNRLYHNLGDGTFEEIAAAAGVTSPVDNFGLHFEDFDNDGWMDLWAPKYEFAPTGQRHLVLFRNLGDGTFSDETTPWTPGIQQDMGHSTYDVDDDGYPDVLAGTGTPQTLNYDHFYRVTPDGQGGFSAQDVTAAVGLQASGMSRMHGMAFGDYDGDGDVDVYCNNGGPQWVTTSLQQNFFWQNQGTPNGWVSLDLTGVLSNRDAVGARAVALTAAGRSIWRYRGVGRGFANTDAPTMHFGLGTDGGVQRIDVLWPSGVRQKLGAAAPGARLAALETGMVASGPALAGGVVPVRLCGPPGDLVDFRAVLVGAPQGRAFWPVATPPAEFPLDAAGLATWKQPVPPVSAGAGAALVLYARIHAPGDPTGGVNSPPIVLPIS